METINRYARSYFSGFCEIWHWKKNDCKTIAFALVKIASYGTLVVPVTMFGLFLLSELVGRVSKKDHLNEQEQKVSKVANSKLPENRPKEEKKTDNRNSSLKKKGKETEAQKNPQSTAKPSKHEEPENKNSTVESSREKPREKKISSQVEEEDDDRRVSDPDETASAETVKEDAEKAPQEFQNRIKSYLMDDINARKKK